MIYLASPYKHDSPNVMAKRAEWISEIAAGLFRLGKIVFAPISYGHAINKCGLYKPDDNFWYEYDLRFFDICNELYIAALPGWFYSIGIMKEYMKAKRLDWPISLIKIEIEDTKLSHDIHFEIIPEAEWHEHDEGLFFLSSQVKGYRHV